MYLHLVNLNNNLPHNNNRSHTFFGMNLYLDFTIGILKQNNFTCNSEITVPGSFSVIKMISDVSLSLFLHNLVEIIYR